MAVAVQPFIERVRITPEKYHDIREIVRLHHEAVVEAVCGKVEVPAAIQQAMEAASVPRYADLPLYDQAAYLGMISAFSPDPLQEGEQDFERWKRRVLHRRETPLSSEEAHAVAFARQKAATYCRGLGNRVSEDGERVLVEADQRLRQDLEATIRDQVAEGIRWRETTEEIRSRLGHATGDWARDFHRIAITEQNNAIQRGRGDAIAEREGEHARVAKVPEPSACGKCRELYLDETGRPRIFDLAEIRFASNARDPENPSNARKMKDWVATLESLHPHCQCQTVWVADGWGFDANWDLIPLDEGEE